ncbi:hypothetical protein GCM10007967_06790 [Xylanimonas ulmi]
MLSDPGDEPPATGPVTAFDLAVAAASVHRMSLDVLRPRLNRALVPAGRFLVRRHVFGEPLEEPTAFRDRVAQVVARRSQPPRVGDPEDVGPTSARLTATGAVRRRGHWRVPLECRTGRGAMHRLFSTLGDRTRDEVEEVAGAVADIGGRVVEHSLSWLIVRAPVPG